jgi:hypothetical protein
MGWFSCLFRRDLLLGCASCNGKGVRYETVVCCAVCVRRFLRVWALASWMGGGGDVWSDRSTGRDGAWTYVTCLNAVLCCAVRRRGRVQVLACEECCCGTQTR